jgi:hypothetical protein
MKFVTVYKNLNQITKLQRILIKFCEILVKYYTNTKNLVNSSDFSGFQ